MYLGLVLTRADFPGRGARKVFNCKTRRNQKLLPSEVIDGTGEYQVGDFLNATTARS